MARVQYGSIITDIKGSIGGMSFQSNNASKISRLKPRPVKSGSAYQFITKSDFNLLVTMWSALTLSEKEDWNTFAAAHTKDNFWNEEKNLSGFNWFITCNYLAEILENSGISSPPTYGTPPAVHSFDVVLTGTEIKFDFGEVWDPDADLLIYATPIIRTVSAINRRKIRYLTRVVNHNSQYLDITTYWENYFGISWPVSLSTSSINIILGIVAYDSGTYVPSVATLGIGEYS